MEKKNHKKGLVVIAIAVLLIASIAVYAEWRSNIHVVELKKIESGKPDSLFSFKIKGDTSLIRDTMKLLKSDSNKIAIVPVDDTTKSEIFLIKR